MHNRVKNLFQAAGVDLARVNFWVEPTGDLWIRDYGPIFIVNQKEQKLALTDWIYNAYGKKYPELLQDTRIPAAIAERKNILRFEPGIVLEGGSIDVNGAGTLLTTEQCLLNPNRNPHLKREEIENYLREYLGVTKIIWLKNGLKNDDTDGHVDDLARFVNPTTVVLGVDDDPKSANYVSSHENLAILKKVTDQNGAPLKIVELPLPHVFNVDGEELAASYTNFYIGNGVVLTPIFGDPHDEEALAILRQCFPGREVVGINCFDLNHGGGTIHCASQQWPSRKV
jgi:agmatine deiminase